MVFNDFLLWLATTGGCTVAASWILSQFKWYTQLLDKARQWVFFGVAAVLGLGAYTGTVYLPAAFITTITPYFLIVSTLFIFVFINNAFTKLTNLEKSFKQLSLKK